MIANNKILIAEDDQKLQRLFNKAFTHAGFECVIADNGHIALEILRKDTPKVIILDLGLPGVTGIEIIKQLQNDTLFDNLIIIIVSGNRSASQINCADRADLIMIKPVSPRDLVNLTKRFANVS